MSVKNNIHFPDYVNIDEFFHDYYDKRITASKMQKKYEISPRQYRLVVRYIREEYNKEVRHYKSPQRKYIYRNSLGLYVVRKKIRGVFKYFGTYESLDDAINTRDKLIECNWDKTMVSI